MTPDSSETASIQVRKRALREEVRRRVSAMTAAQRSDASLRLCRLLQAQEVWKRANTILFYAPLPSEVELWPLIAQSLLDGKHPLLPRFTNSGVYEPCQIADLAADIQPGQFGIREPAAHCPAIPINRLDLALVPGVAFDLQGRRLGRGKGFYDRLLPTVRGTRCGIAFDEQLVAEVPVEPHDVLLNCILTPSRCIELEKRAVLE